MITTVVADGKNEYEFIDLLKKRAQNSDKNVVPIVSERNIPLNLTEKHLKR